MISLFDQIEALQKQLQALMPFKTEDKSHIL